MKSFNQKTGISKKRPVIERIEKLHPYKMINYLIISVSCLLYALLSYLFIKQLAFELKGDIDVTLPKFFSVSTILLLCSVYFTSGLLIAYKTDRITEIRKLLSYTLIAGLLFFISQALAWIELLKDGDVMDINKSANYLFAFSALHIFYLLTGLVVSALLFYRYMMIEHDPVKSLIAATNPMEKMKLEVFRSFWHFIVFSWTLIFLMILFVF